MDTIMDKADVSVVSPPIVSIHEYVMVDVMNGLMTQLESTGLDPILAKIGKQALDNSEKIMKILREKGFLHSLVPSLAFDSKDVPPFGDLNMFVLSQYKVAADKMVFPDESMKTLFLAMLQQGLHASQYIEAAEAELSVAFCLVKKMLDRKETKDASTSVGSKDALSSSKSMRAVASSSISPLKGSKSSSIDLVGDGAESAGSTVASMKAKTKAAASKSASKTPDAKRDRVTCKRCRNHNEDCTHCCCAGVQAECGHGSHACANTAKMGKKNCESCLVVKKSRKRAADELDTDSEDEHAAPSKKQKTDGKEVEVVLSEDE